MSNWRKVCLEDITINLDKLRVPLSSKERLNLDRKYRYYGAQGIIDYVDKYIFDGEYILVAEDGENLKSQKNNICNFVTGKFWVNNHAHILQAKENNNLKFIYYLLNLINFRPYITGSAQPKLTQDNLNQIDLTIPDFPTQQKIASVLSALDSKIDLNNRINAELEAMAKTLYDYWFVQFDFPDRHGKPYKSSSGKMVWNNELKREIPDGWNVFKLGDVLETSLGGTPSTNVSDYWDDGTFNWLNSGEIANFPIVDSELKITKAAIRSSATELLPKGTTLLSITRHLRPTVLAIDACANQSVVGIKEKNDIKYYFIYPYLKNEIRRLITLRTGAQQPHINKQTVDDSLIVIPNEDANTLKLYNSKVGCVYEQIVNNSFQNQQLAELRDWLLPMLMNGQVTVNG
jgi:type I restriction enzyme S subunit